MQTKTKRCPQCGATKAQSDFYSNVAQLDGLSCQCKECTRASHKRYYWADVETNREKAREMVAAWRARRRAQALAA